MTSVDPDGYKVETKVFAGGTHIATQMGDGGEQILFHTADPVTGMMGTFAGSGTYTIKIDEKLPGRCNFCFWAAGYDTISSKAERIARR